MRYKIGETAAENAYAGSAHFVELTVFVTLLIGIGFILAGVYGKQVWLKMWGVFTVIACAVFYTGQILGWFRL